MNQASSEDRLIKFINLPIKKNKVKIGLYNINFITVGSGKPLLLIHGANIGWGQWYPNLAALSKKFSVYALDLPGSGDSSLIDYKKTDFDKDYVETVKKFIIKNELKNFDIVGHSIGGAITLKLINDSSLKIDKIVLVDSLGFTDHIPHKQKVVSIYPIVKLLTKTVLTPNKSYITSFLNSVTYKKNIFPDEFIDYFCNSALKPNNHPLLFMNSLSRYFKMKPETLSKKNLKKIKNKTLILYGERDPIIPIKKIEQELKEIPNVHVKIFKDTGHIPFIENSILFNKEIINFLLKPR